ncbi:MAG: biliverdin-producing heme oxygenase, partial [Myxococcales bacterium]|nr:biliverdin-producing heme oxygenase [Myxococcales bacterium]
MSVIESLRRAGEGAHERLESTPFAKSLLEGRVERQRYLDYLRAIAIIIDSLRTQTRLYGTASQRTVFECAADWSERLAADLAHLGAGSQARNHPAHVSALAFVDQLQRRFTDGSAFPLGVAYVLTGSHRGHRSIANKIKAALALPDDKGIRFMSATRGQGEGPWKAFLALLERELQGPSAVAEAMEGVRATYAVFEEILTALGEDTTHSLHVSVLNPEAGNHPIPQDPEIVSLAVTVAEEATAAFPYLDFRYRQRGHRFARSDSAWLVTLAEYGPESAQRQIEWLAGVLATRGMPTIVLEHHLRLLAEALDRARREDTGARLHQLADHVARHRSDELLSRCSPGRVEVPELGEDVGRLLACAVVDQHAGIGAC